MEMKMLRLAQPEDWEEVNRISRQVHSLHVSWRPDIFRHTDNTYPEEYFQDDIQEELVYVAIMNSVIVGYVRFFTWETNSDGSVPSKVLDIDDITVDEIHRGQGVGKEIMEDVKSLARELGCNDIQLSVYPQNETAVRFYESCGFKVRNIRYQMYI